jgi:hypothetical protein
LDRSWAEIEPIGPKSFSPNLTAIKTRINQR